jgi:hypothetical protein
VLRGAFDLTPMFLIVAHDISNGRSFLVDLLATLITGRWCPVISPGETSEENPRKWRRYKLPRCPLSPRVKNTDCCDSVRGRLDR